MQSKLPVRIKRKHLFGEKKKCCCAQLLQFMIDNPNDSSNTFSDEKVLGSCTSKSFSANKQCFSRSTQTDNHYDYNKNSYLEIKSLLLSINSSLENILHTLKDKKSFLYNKLHEESCIQCKNVKIPYSKNKMEKVKKKAMQISKKYNVFPEMTRLCYGYPLWPKHYMQRSAYNLSPTTSNLIICPKLCTRPFSCPNINYFQTMGRILHRKALGAPICPHPIVTLVGRGFKCREDNNNEDVNEQSDTQEVDEGLEKSCM